MIRLRTFIILSSLFVVTLTLFASWTQMKNALEKSALSLQERELEHISQLVKAAIETKKSELKNYTRVIRTNNDLASAYIIAKESGDLALVDAKLEKIKTDVGFDFAEIVSLTGKGIHPRSFGMDDATLQTILTQKEGQASTLLLDKPAMISFSPLLLYDEPIALVVLGYFPQGELSQSLSKITNSEIQFSIAPPGTLVSPTLDLPHGRRSFRTDGSDGSALSATIALAENPAGSLWKPLFTRLIVSGAISLGLLLVLLYCFLEFGFVRGFRAFVSEVNDASQDVGRGEPRELRASSSRIYESNLLFRASQNFVTSLIAYQRRMEQQVILEEAARKQKALSDLARQVAHDIRSPLSALLVATDSLAEVPEENRLLIRAAVSRIQDIANNLITKHREIEVSDAQTPATQVSPSNCSVQLLSSLIESILSEKRLQFRHRIDVLIEAKLEHTCYALFANVDPGIFKTTISNLVDNSVESLGSGGNILVSLKDADDRIAITVDDTGRGIPENLLPYLAQRGGSFNKQNGSGLGLFHAKTSIESWGGTLEIASSVGVGTKVTILLPKAEPPKWFVHRIDLSHDATVVVADDDASIHQIWEKRFSADATEQTNKIVHLSTPKQLADWAATTPRKALYLVDYEFLGESENGLRLIETLGIENQSILVTSRYEEPKLIEQCLAKSIRLIPKGMAGFVPIHFHVVGSDDPSSSRSI